MAFLTQADFDIFIKDANLMAMIEGDTATLETAIVKAVAQAREYLFARYDVETIFAATGSARHPHLVTVCTDIALYRLHKRNPKRMVPEHIQNDYNEAMSYLERISDGKIDADLPRKTVESIEITRIRIGSNPPRDL